jgi:hypothetical protein
MKNRKHETIMVAFCSLWKVTYPEHRSVDLKGDLYRGRRSTWLGGPLFVTTQYRERMLSGFIVYELRHVVADIL